MAKKKSSDIRIRLTKREREAIDAKSGGNPEAFVKGIALRASMKELKTRGRSGNRTHPTESAPTAADKTAVPPGRGQPSDNSTLNNDREFTGEDIESEIILRESERGIVLVTSSMIDDVLEAMLRAEFNRRSESRDVGAILNKLLKDQPLPPLGSFAVRALVCFVLGLIDDSQLTAFEVIRGLRNKCAHRSSHHQITQQSVDAVMQALMNDDARRRIEELSQKQSQDAARVVEKSVSLGLFSSAGGSRGLAKLIEIFQAPHNLCIFFVATSQRIEMAN